MPFQFSGINFCGAGAPPANGIYPQTISQFAISGIGAGRDDVFCGAGAPARETIKAVFTATGTKYNYRRRLPHFQYDDKALFVTFATFTHAILGPAARNLVLRHCLHDHTKKYLLHAAVVMPEHVHVLLSPLRDAAGEVFPLREILQSLKGASAHSIDKASGRQGPVWEEESFDHVLRPYESLEEKLEYIRQNPVKRGLAKNPEEYRWLWVAPKII